MSDQQQNTTTEAPPKQAQPQPCKAGCGFFGSNATGDCCSKCYNEKLAKEAKKNVDMNDSAAVPPPSTKMEATSITEALSSQPKPMDIDDLPPSSTTEAAEVTTITTDTTTEVVVKKPLKKKKKKASYKSMMAGMMTVKDDSGDCQKHADKIRSNTGGGAFTKVDRI